MNLINTLIKKKILQTIEQYSMVHPHDRILLAVSGGPDSILLWHLFCQIRTKKDLSLIIAHLNHKIRKKDADHDQEFLKELAADWDCPLISETIDIPELKKRYKSLSLEEIAHNERLKFLEKTFKEQHCTTIAFGHTLDDSIEYFFLKAFNGGSLNSLAGIKPVENHFIRPLIQCTKKEILEYLKANKIKYRIDKSNQDTAIPRNWIRHQLIPYIEKNYKPIKNNIFHLIDILYQENEYIKTGSRDAVKYLKYNKSFYSICFQLKPSQPPALIRRIVKNILEAGSYPVSYYIINSFSNYISGPEKLFLLINDLYLWHYKEQYIFTPVSEINDYFYKIRLSDLPKTVQIRELSLQINISIMEKNIDKYENNIIYISMKNQDEFIIRNKKEKDYIQLMNTNYNIKLKKLFIDLKIPNPLKKMIPLIECSGKIAALFLNTFPLYLTNRINEEYKIDPQSSNIIKMEFKQNI